MHEGTRVLVQRDFVALYAGRVIESPETFLCHPRRPRRNLLTRQTGTFSHPTRLRLGAYSLDKFALRCCLLERLAWAFGSSRPGPEEPILSCGVSLRGTVSRSWICSERGSIKLTVHIVEITAGNENEASKALDSCKTSLTMAMHPWRSAYSLSPIVSGME